MKSLLSVLLIAGLLTVGCATPPRSETKSHSGFAPGQNYVTTRALLAVTWGRRTILVDELRVKEYEDQPTRVENLEPGAMLTVTAIREENTLTHGMETWPEARIESGSLKGTRVSLVYSDVGRFLQPAGKKR